MDNIELTFEKGYIVISDALLSVQTQSIFCYLVCCQNSCSHTSGGRYTNVAEFFHRYIFTPDSTPVISNAGVKIIFLPLLPFPCRMMVRSKVLLLTLVTFLLTKVVKSFDYQTQSCDRPGTDVIVQLFEWKWSDIAKECETFLGPHNFCAVQVSPPNENRIISNRPWVERYEPVSYKIQTRSGNESEFQTMVRKCSDAKIRVYADIVINHMTDVNHHGYGTGGSVYHGEQRTYPSVPYGGWDFHDKIDCHTKDQSIQNYSNAEEVRNCQLQGKADINHKKDYVQDYIVDYLNKLLDVGVSGFRIADAKHMWPLELKTIFRRLKNVTSFTGGSQRPFIYHEFDEIPGEAIDISEYFSLGRVEYGKYGMDLTSLIRSHELKSTYTNWGTTRGMPSPSNLVTFIDDQIKQRDVSHPVYTHRDRRMYEAVNAFMLAFPYGIPRVFSGYSYSRVMDGPPHHGDMSTTDVTVDSNGNCIGGWACEHRWRAISNMVDFRRVVDGSNVHNWWHNNANQIAFSRGNKGFIVINAETSTNINRYFQTSLPSGTFCDVISGYNNRGSCTGTSIFVRHDGLASISLSQNSNSPVMAFHIGSKSRSK